MRQVRIGLVGVAVAAVLMLAQSLAASAAAPALSPKPISPARAQSLGYQAYMYGFPLLEFLRVTATETSVRCPDANGDEPVNTFSQHSRLARPSDRTVIAPNVDTLYSIAHLDLGRGPVVLSHPNMGHRYFVFELLDPYTNVLGYIGSRTTGSEAGRFAIEWTRHPAPVARGVKVIHSSYRRVWVVGRTLVYGGARDSRRAMALMRRYRLTPPGGARHFAHGCQPGKPHKAVTPVGIAFLRKLDTALTNNPPPARDHRLLRKLARVGVGPHLSVAEAGLAPDVLRALIAGVDQAAASLPTLARGKVLQEALADHGWATIGNGIGAYGTDYLWRAEVAELGLGANTVQEAVYPTALTDSSGRPLSGISDYRLVFKPRPGATQSRLLVADDVRLVRISGAQSAASLCDREHPPAAAPAARWQHRDPDLAHAAAREPHQLAAGPELGLSAQPADLPASPRGPGRALAAAPGAATHALIRPAPDCAGVARREPRQ